MNCTQTYSFGATSKSCYVRPMAQRPQVGAGTSLLQKSKVRLLYFMVQALPGPCTCGSLCALSYLCFRAILHFLNNSLQAKMKYGLWGFHMNKRNVVSIIHSLQYPFFFCSFLHHHMLKMTSRSFVTTVYLFGLVFKGLKLY